MAHTLPFLRNSQVKNWLTWRQGHFEGVQAHCLAPTGPLFAATDARWGPPRSMAGPESISQRCLIWIQKERLYSYARSVRIGT
jgi:hypothetical protein